jgi:predicted phage terminase large subunit-like protein
MEALGALNSKWGFAVDQDLKQYYKNTSGGHRMAMSVTSGATGNRGSTLMFDDLVNVKEDITVDKLEEAKSWWNVTMGSRGNDPAKLQKIGIMQRVAENDPVADLSSRRRSDGTFEYDLLLLPTEYDPELYAYYGRDSDRTSIGWRDWRTTPGELLFPEYFDARAVEDAKVTLGSMTYSANHAQRPIPATGGFFQQRWWRFWYPEGGGTPAPVRVKLPDGSYEECAQVPLPEVTSKYMSCDLTFKGGKNSDFVALQVWAYGAKPPFRSSFFLLDQTHRRADFPQTLVEIEKLVGKHPDIGIKLIEDAANGPAVISSLRDKMTGVVAVPPLGGKTARANAVAPTIESGHVYLPHPKVAPWVQGLLAELASFPKGKNDDQVDALTQALARKRVIVV